MVRNERWRYLPEVLDWHAQWGPLVVLDDNSDDGTYEVCRDHAAVVVAERTPSPEHPAWGMESAPRKQLWELAAKHADWFLVCDADQILSSDPRPLLESVSVNAWSFPLYDLWDARDTYREDGYWRGHLHPRPWLFHPHRVPHGYVPEWSKRGIHVGHCPANFPLVEAVAPANFYWLHLSYLDADDRAAKLTRYRSQYHQMSDFEKAHAESIADPHPSLKILPFAKPVRILVGGPVRKRADILQAHLDSLAAQELPTRVEVTYCFVDDYPDEHDPARKVLHDFVQVRGKVLKSAQTSATDFSDTHPVTHQWTTSSMTRMGNLKHGLMKECVDGGYDFLWLVDSDLICDRTTLASLLTSGKQVVSAVYWTRWNTDPKICAGPQVWLKPVYQLGLPHYPEHEFRNTLGVKRKLEKVGGLGACTLIARSVIEKGVNFSKPEGFPSGGLWDGEDRHFCEWARRLHVELWADPWPDIFHVYNVATDVERMPEMVAQLSAPHPMFCNVGHLVSVGLMNVENGIGPYHIRCRIGDGMLLPEIETHLMGMQRGETKIARIHFPNTTPPVGDIQLANQNRLIQIELLDCKPFGLPPVLADEFYVSVGGASVQDRTHLTAEQHVLMQEAK